MIEYFIAVLISLYVIHCIHSAGGLEGEGTIEGALLVLAPLLIAIACLSPLFILYQACWACAWAWVIVHGSLSAFGEWLCSLKQRYGLLLTLIVCGLVPVVLFFIFNWYQSRTFGELLGIVAVGSLWITPILDEHQSILDEHQSTKIKRIKK
jgi:hypothetical protein